MTEQEIEDRVAKRKQKAERFSQEWEASDEATKAAFGLWNENWQEAERRVQCAACEAAEKLKADFPTGFDAEGTWAVVVHPAIVKRRYRRWKRLQGQSRGTDRQLETDLIATAGRVRDRFRRRTKVAGLGEAWLRYMILQSGLGTDATRKASVIVIAGWSSARIKQVQRLSKALMAEHKTEKQCLSANAALLTELVSAAGSLDRLLLEKGFDRLPFTLADEIQKRLERVYVLEADAPGGETAFDVGEAISKPTANIHTFTGFAPDPQRRLEAKEAMTAKAEQFDRWKAALTERERALVELTGQFVEQETADSPKLTDQDIADGMNAMPELAKPAKGFTAPDVRNLRMRAWEKYGKAAG